MRVQPCEESTDTARGHGHAGIGCSVIEANRIPVFVDDLTARKYNVVYVSIAFVRSLGAK
jgi:hypothetical protein